MSAMSLSAATLSYRPVRRVLVDTSAYYALAIPQDSEHVKAVALVSQLSRRPAQLFTTNLVIPETHGLLIARRGRAIAATFLRDIARSVTTIVRVSAVDERRAREIGFQYDDKEFSLTDATSFAVMERLVITHAFTFDRHFRQYGLAVLSPDE